MMNGPKALKIFLKDCEQQGDMITMNLLKHGLQIINKFIIKSNNTKKMKMNILRCDDSTV